MLVGVDSSWHGWTVALLVQRVAKGPDLIYATPEWAALLRKGWDRLLQRRIVFGRRPEADSNTGRLRSKGQAILLPTDAMSLAEEGVASGWRLLAWFWRCVAAMAVVGGAVLALLGPPSGRAARGPVSQPETATMQPQPAMAQPQPATAQPQPDGVALAKAASPASQPLTRHAAEMLVQAEPPAAEPAAPSPAPQPTQPDQPPRDWADPPLAALAPAAQASENVAQPAALPRSRVLVVLHPARAAGEAAVAQRLAAKAGIPAEQVNLGAVGEARTEAAIRFYSESDHALARRIGRELGGMGYNWKLQNYSDRPGAPKGAAIEVWLPDR